MRKLISREGNNLIHESKRSINSEVDGPFDASISMDHLTGERVSINAHQKEIALALSSRFVTVATTSHAGNTYVDALDLPVCP